MAKKISISFDDGRLDTYINAIPILKKYSLTCTINIITDFIEHPGRYTKFTSGANKAMSISNVLEANDMGMEIACHGHTHNNTILDINTNIKKLKSWGVPTDNIGFASPYSYITPQNIYEIDSLLKNGSISYIRSGVQVRREGILHSGKYLIQELTGSSKLFYILNRNLIFKFNNQDKFVYGISVTKNTKLHQIKYFIDRIPDNSCAILIFHSILYPDNEGYGEDKWYWNAHTFERLCQYICDIDEIQVLNTIDMWRENK